MSANYRDALAEGNSVTVVAVPFGPDTPLISASSL
jgi:hypothetical protein